MKFVFADSLDLVDPSFDFETEDRSLDRVRQRDDRYPHELFAQAPYEGILVSKAIVDGIGGGGAGRYTLAQRQRLFREGVRSFFRIESSRLFTMGDCGAFTYVKEEYPPYSVEDVISFYDTCGFDYGISVDHVILGFDVRYDTDLFGSEGAPQQWRRRQELTFELADRFLQAHRAGDCRFQPIGVAQGWSPKSYARAVSVLQTQGYRYIALGGLVPLKTAEIVASLEAANSVRRPDVAFHLLGVTRLDALSTFARFGAISFDSTSPLRQAFKDDKDNYYTQGRTYPALRVPQVEGNPRLQRLIRSGQVDGAIARTLEQKCLTALSQYDQGDCAIDEVLVALRDYEILYDSVKDRTLQNRETLTDQPWKDCPCEVCAALGIHVVIFRGAERNRRRGFHNLHAFHRRLRMKLALSGNSRPDTAIQVKAEPVSSQ